MQSAGLESVGSGESPLLAARLLQQTRPLLPVIVVRSWASLDFEIEGELKQVQRKPLYSAAKIISKQT